jgi:glycosyltransferase involved in cell wall biosynthesis
VTELSLAGRRIAIVTAGLGAGGAERVIADISERWLAGGARVTIVCFDAPEDRIYHPMPPRVRILKLGIPGQGGSATVYARLRTLRAALRAIGPDVVVSFLTKINVLTLLATIGMKVPVVVAERNNPERQDAHVLWRLASRLAHARASVVVCQTTGSTRCVPYFARNRVRVIPNPVGTAKLRPKPFGRSVLVAVGRLTPQKGFDMLVDAFARVSKDHPAWDLHIWGEGPERDALRARIDRAGLDSRIFLRGLSSEPGSWLMEASAFVLSSRYEGFPNVLGEALAAGLPVVATDCDFGPTDLILDGENGMLVEPDSVPALAAGLDRLLADEGLRNRFRAKAPEVVERYAFERIFRAWDEVLTSLLSDARFSTEAREVKAV